MLAANVRDGFAVGFDDLEIVIVDPNAPLEVTFLAFDFFRSDIEDVAVQFVLLLLADIKDVVFGQILGREDKGQFVPDILHVFPRHINLLQAGLGSKHHVLNAVTFVVEQDVEHFVVFTVHGAAVQGLYLYVLAVRILLARLGELGFFFSETLDDFFRADTCGLRIVEGAFLGKCWHDRDCAGQAEQQTAE